MTDIKRIPLKSNMTELKEVKELIKEFNYSSVLYSGHDFQYECKICKFTFLFASHHAIVLHIGMKHPRGFKKWLISFQK